MPEAGSLLGAYRILRPLGRGGMGTVYEAEHVELRVRRALKVFSTESEHAALLRRRFVAEGRILADLRHPRIVRVCDFAVDSATGAPYFAMDLVVASSGSPQTLEDACRDGADEERIAGWFRDICEGLAYIHSRGVVHRDVSLDNILIDREGRAVITDFGIAKITGEAYRRQIDLTRTLPLKDGSRLSWGKGLYLSPELRRDGEATPASDAYALGVLLFRVLAGSWYTPSVRLEDALAGFDGYNWAEIVGRLCAADPSDRLGADGLAGVAARLRKASAPAKGGHPSRRRIWIPLAGALVLLAFGAGVAARRRAAAPPAAASVRPAQVIHVVDVTNAVPQTVIRVVDVTNTVIRVVDVTNRVSKLNRSADFRACRINATPRFAGSRIHLVLSPP